MNDKPKRDTATTDEASFFDVFNDIRVIRAVGQVIFAIAVALLLAVLWSNIYGTLISRGLEPNFDFLSLRAGFSINESPEWYSTNSTYREAFFVGVLNTLRAVSVGLVGATILGILLGIFLLSSNWLIKTISRVYVEILRNTPLLVQLIFWYYVVMLGLPRDDITLPNEGVFVFSLRMIVYIAVIGGAWFYSQRKDAPFRLISGVVIGIIGLELAFNILGTSAVMIIGLGLAGAGLLGFGRLERAPEQYRGWLQGAGLVGVVQLFGHGILDLLFRSGLVGNPQVVYSELSPAVYIGRQGFIMPEFWTNIRSETLLAMILAGVVIAWVVSQLVHAYSERTGNRLPASLIAFVTFGVFSIGGWYLAQINVPAELGQGALVFNAAVGDAPLELGINLETPRVMLFSGLAVVSLVIVAGLLVVIRTIIETEYIKLPVIRIGVFLTIALLLVSWHVSRLPAAENTLLIAMQEQTTNDDGVVTETTTDIVMLDSPEEAAELPAYSELSDERLAYLFAEQPLNVVLPERGRFRFDTGTELSLSYTALVLGLIVYTSAFIGEIVRAGIQAVPYGQLEAASALGLTNAQTLRLVILPQALRVIIPPLGNQYLNLAKNSSLAVAIAFADTYQVGTTIMNQSGQSITGFTLVLITYLTMSLLISLVMNIVNSRFQLVTR